MLLTTESVAPRERFAYWREVISRRFVALRPEPVASSADFFGELEPVALGSLSATRVRSVPQRVLRGAREIAASPAELFFLNLQLAGTSSAAQRGEPQRLRSGDWSLLDANHPFELRVAEPIEHLSIAIPQARLAPLLPADLRAYCGRRVDGSKGAGKLVADLLRSRIECGTLPGEALAAVDAQLVPLVAAALSCAHGEDAAGDAARAIRYARALRFIERICARPELRPRDVAAELRVSLRYLQLLFAERGDRVGRRLLQARLARAERALSDPSLRRLSILEIALRAGFRDASYFARAFARAYGASPRVFRARHQRGTP